MLHCIAFETSVREPAMHMPQMCTVAVLSDKWEIFQLFALDGKVSNYLTNIEYARNGQYSNVVEFELRHIPKDLQILDNVSNLLYGSHVL